MSDDLKNNKENLLRQLLSAQPELGMKEANALIRAQFDTGVSPPVFSKIKKELEENAATEAQKPVAEIKAEAAEKKCGKITATFRLTLICAMTSSRVPPLARFCCRTTKWGVVRNCFLESRPRILG